MVCGIKNLTQTRKDKASVPYPVAYPGFSKGGARKFEIMKTKRKIFALRISSFSGLKLREDRKKSLHSKLVRFLAQNYVKTKKNRSLPRFCPFVCSNFLPKLQRGAMPRFCILFYANYTILATQRGGHGTMLPP